MLGNLVASKAAKIAALCVCPVGAAVVTTQVPMVRSAVHRMTAPPHVPARRIAPRALPALQTAQAAPCPTAIPVVLQGADPLKFDLPTTGEALFAEASTPRLDAFPSTQPRLVPVADFVPPSAPEVHGDLPILPETMTWMQFGLGFALLGSAIRAPAVRARIVSAKAARAA